MSTALVAAWLALLPGFIIGYIAHEASHWLVLRATGINASLSLWPPEVSFTTDQYISPGVRIAAVSPLLVGVVVFCLAVATINTIGPIGFGASVGAAARLCFLSREDLAIARGRRIREFSG